MKRKTLFISIILFFILSISKVNALELSDISGMSQSEKDNNTIKLDIGETRQLTFNDKNVTNCYYQNTGLTIVFDSQNNSCTITADSYYTGYIYLQEDYSTYYVNVDVERDYQNIINNYVPKTNYIISSYRDSFEGLSINSSTSYMDENGKWQQKNLNYYENEDGTFNVTLYFLKYVSKYDFNGDGKSYYIIYEKDFKFENNPQTYISLNNKNIKTGEITSIYYNNIKKEKLLFTSEDNRVASIDAEGRITGQGQGNTTIKVYLSSSQELITSFDITVNNAAYTTPQQVVDYFSNYTYDCVIEYEEHNYYSDKGLIAEFLTRKINEIYRGNNYIGIYESNITNTQDNIYNISFDIWENGSQKTYTITNFKFNKSGIKLNIPSIIKKGQSYNLDYYITKANENQQYTIYPNDEYYTINNHTITFIKEGSTYIQLDITDGTTYSSEVVWINIVEQNIDEIKSIDLQYSKASVENTSRLENIITAIYKEKYSESDITIVCNTMDYCDIKINSSYKTMKINYGSNSLPNELKTFTLNDKYNVSLNDYLLLLNNTDIELYQTYDYLWNKTEIITKLQSLTNIPIYDLIEISYISISKYFYVLNNVNDKQKIEYTAFPQNANYGEVTFTSSNPNVATISKDGTITAVGNGYTIIKIKSRQNTQSITVLVGTTIENFLNTIINQANNIEINYNNLNEGYIHEIRELFNEYGNISVNASNITDTTLDLQLSIYNNGTTYNSNTKTISYIGKGIKYFGERDINLSVGESYTLDLLYSEGNIDELIISSSNYNVSIEGNKITAVSKGLAEITIQDKDGKYYKYLYVNIESDDYFSQIEETLQNSNIELDYVNRYQELDAILFEYLGNLEYRLNIIESTVTAEIWSNSIDRRITFDVTIKGIEVNYIASPIFTDEGVFEDFMDTNSSYTVQYTLYNLTGTPTLTSKTPSICTINGLTINSLNKNGLCIVDISLNDHSNRVKVVVGNDNIISTYKNEISKYNNKEYALKVSKDYENYISEWFENPETGKDTMNKLYIIQTMIDDINNKISFDGIRLEILGCYRENTYCIYLFDDENIKYSVEEFQLNFTYTLEELSPEENEEALKYIRKDYSFERTIKELINNGNLTYEDNHEKICPSCILTDGSGGGTPIIEETVHIIGKGNLIYGVITVKNENIIHIPKSKAQDEVSIKEYIENEILTEYKKYTLDKYGYEKKDKPLFAYKGYDYYCYRIEDKDICIHPVIDEEKHLESISLNKTSNELNIGEEDNLIVIYNPSDTTDDKTVTWTSSDDTKATVVDGKVTAISSGNVTITAKVNGLTAIYNLVVKALKTLEDIINDNQYKINNEYVSGITLGETIESLKIKFGNKVEINSKTDKVGTGTELLLNNEKYTIVMTGDVNGDGEINSADLLKMRQYLLGTTELNGAYYQAGSIAKGTEINSADLLRMRQHLLGTKAIEQ